MWYSRARRTLSGRSEQAARSYALARSLRHPQRGRCSRAEGHEVIRHGCASPGQVISEVMVADILGG